MYANQGVTGGSNGEIIPKDATVPVKGGGGGCVCVGGVIKRRIGPNLSQQNATS